MPGSEDKELIKNVRATRDDKGRILLNSVCQRLIELGFNVAGTLISYYSPIDEMYIFVGKEPIAPEKDGISVDNLSKNRLHLKFRPAQDSSPKAWAPSTDPIIQLGQAQGIYPDIISLEPMYRQMSGIGMPSSINTQPTMIQPTPVSVAPPPVPTPPVSNPIIQSSKVNAELGDSSDEKGSNVEEGNQEIWSSSKANRRTKERKISFVIEKVSMWRKLYNGIQDNQGKIVRYRYLLLLIFFNKSAIIFKAI